MEKGGIVWRMSDTYPELAKRRGRTTGLREPIPPPVPVAVARPRDVRTAPPRTSTSPCSEEDDAGDVGFEPIHVETKFRTYCVIDSPDHSRHFLSRSSGEQDGSQKIKREGLPGRRRTRTELSSSDRSTLLNYMDASEVGAETMWTCRRCHKPMKERKDDGTLNITTMQGHVRRCYEVPIFEERGSESENTVGAGAEPKAAAFRSCRVVCEGLPDYSHQLPASSDEEDDCSELSCTHSTTREEQSGRSVRADLSPNERSVLSNYLRASGTGEEAVWTCQNCNRALNERKSHGHVNTANILFHVLQCYKLPESAYEDLRTQVPSRRGLRSGRAPPLMETGGARVDLSPKERAVLSSYLDSSDTGQWTCKKCNRAMNERKCHGKSNITNIFSHVSHCYDLDGSSLEFMCAEVPATSYRQDMATSNRQDMATSSAAVSSVETPPPSRPSSPKLQQDAFASSLPESELEETAEVRDGRVPYWDMDVVLNVPETPHGGYTALVDAVVSAKVPRGQMRWEYLVLDQVSKVMNATLPKRARYLVREANGTFRLASPFELRAKILEMFSQREQRDEGSDGDPGIGSSSVPLEIVRKDAAHGQVPREVLLSASSVALWVGQRSEGSLNRKRKGPRQPVDRRPLMDVESERRAGNLTIDDGVVRPMSPPDALSESSKKRAFVLVDNEPTNWAGSSLH